MTAKNTICLWFDKDGLDAAKFYAATFPNTEITAVRNDPYIQRYGAPVEVEQPAAERGTYLHPELYGQPEELGLDYPMTTRRPNAGQPAPAPAP